MKTNTNIKERIMQFPEDLIDISLMIIEDIEKGKKTIVKIEESIKNEVRELISEEDN